MSHQRPPPHGLSLYSPISLFSICGPITRREKKCALLCQGLPGGIGLFQSSPPASHPTGSCKETARRLPLRYHSQGKMGKQLKRSECAECGIHSIWLLRHLNYLAHAVLLVIVGGGWGSGISEGRWGENITVESNPESWIKKKNEMHYSWLITPGSDCINTNCKWWVLTNDQQTTLLRCKYLC